MNKPKQCKLCGEKTSTVFNLNFKAVSVCDKCADSIMVQQSQWYAYNRNINELKSAFQDIKGIPEDMQKIINEKFWDLL